MDFKLTEEQQRLRGEFEDFFREEMKNAPICYQTHSSLEAIYDTDEGFAFHQRMQKKLGEKGWLTMAWPKVYGGREAPIIEQVLFGEVRSYHRAPGVDGFGIRMFAPTLMLFASDEQKKRLLPPIGRGEVNYCQGWSEPNAGSDLASLSTTAVKDGDHYIVNGQKTWTSAAHRADHMFLLARTDPSQKRSGGLSVFNIEMDTPGIEIRPIKYMNGGHFYNEVFFTDVRVHQEELIGPENEGWKLTRATMNFERSGSDAYARLTRSFEELLAYVKNTYRDGKPLAENPIVRQKLARLYADIKSGWAYSYHIAWLQEKGKMASTPAAASEAKVFGTELTQRMVNFATEIMGLYGQLEYSKWAPMNGTMVEGYQSVIGTTIYAGSNEIQRNIIAWAGLGLPRFK
jgi:alkylation response protein AidB-like acyl-CoA dehydrogenase